MRNVCKTKMAIVDLKKERSLHQRVGGGKGPRPTVHRSADQEGSAEDVAPAEREVK